MAEDDVFGAQSQVSRPDAVVSISDLIASLGKAGVLRRPSVFPFFYRVSIPDSEDSSKNFPEMQNTDLVEFHIETDGEVTIKSNIFRLLGGSSNLLLNGSFGLSVPEGRQFPLDFVPLIDWVNDSGGTRELTFYGWLAPLERRFRALG